MVVRDEEVVVHPEAPGKGNQDICGIYVDADHSGGERVDAIGAQMYFMVPGPQQANPTGENPALVRGNTRESGVRGAFLHENQYIVYEWAIPLFEQLPDRGLQIEPGKTAGLDLVVGDADGEEANNLVFWASEERKSRSSDLLGIWFSFRITRVWT